MFTCPRCSATLVNNTGYCQFCQATWAAPAAPRGTPLPATAPGLGQPAPWVWKAYYGIAGWWILYGAWIILRATVIAPPKNAAVVVVAFGAFLFLVGIGLVMKAALIRNIVKFLCFLNILFELLGLLFSFLFFLTTGFVGILSLLLILFNIGLSGLMIYVIGETDQGVDF